MRMDDRRMPGQLEPCCHADVWIDYDITMICILDIRRWWLSRLRFFFFFALHCNIYGYLLDI